MPPDSTRKEESITSVPSFPLFGLGLIYNRRGRADDGRSRGCRFISRSRDDTNLQDTGTHQRQLSKKFRTAK